jgi:hypothetical protein
MSTKVRTPRPKLARGDSHHGQSLHGRELAELERLEQSAHSEPESFIDELERRSVEPVVDDLSKYLPETQGAILATREYMRVFAARKAANPSAYIKHYSGSRESPTGDPIIDEGNKVRLETT